MSGALIKPIRQILLDLSKTTLPYQPSRSPSGSDAEAGFTLIEVIVIIVIISVLAAIAGPSWLGFLRQRQATAVRDEIFSALQTAQSEAKRTNLSRTVEFNASSPSAAEFKVYNPTLPGAASAPFTQLGRDRGVEPGQVEISLPNNLRSITFDYQGVPDYVTSTTNTQVEDLPATDAIFTVTVSPAETSTDSQKRCVIIQTLLGGMRAASGSECN